MNSLMTAAYFRSPVWIQNLVVSAYGLRLRHLRYGPMQRRALAELRDSQWADAARLEARQLASLNTLLAGPVARLDFYRDRGTPSALSSLRGLRHLPVLRKSDVQAAGRGLVDPLVPESQLVRVYTGGTTGKSLTVFCDRPALQRNYAFFARFREWTGVPPGARTATFAGRTVVPPGQTRPPYWRSNVVARTVLFSSYHLSAQTADAYLDRLGRFGPELIDSYPSSLEPLARRIIELGRTDVRPRAIITSSETLLAQSRERLTQAFGCRVFDHYGAAEMAALITQCPSGSYHVNPEFGVVELLRDDGEPALPGEPGQIVATGFVNPVMPLLRYATGDVGVWGEPDCPCGRAFPVVAELRGRMDDVIVTPEGRLVGRLDPIFKGLSSLYETRLVQDAPDHLRVEVVPAGSLREEDCRVLLRELANRLGPSMRVEIVSVAAIPRERSGKLRAVVNLVAGPRASIPHRAAPGTGDPRA